MILPPGEDHTDEDRRAVGQKRSISDRLFRGAGRAGGAAVLAIMLLVGMFLTIQAAEALRVAGWRFVTTQAWDPEALNFGIAGVLAGTVFIGLVAIACAIPLATGTALYISEYATGAFQRTLISVVDLMAAVPSVVYGIWGLFLLQPEWLVSGPQGEGLPRFLATYFGWIPFLRVDGYEAGDPLASPSVFTSSTFVAGIIVSMMVTPIICSIMREVFSQAPIGEREGAYALGATRWGMIRMVVLPFGKGGMIGATMLGLGRALGETIAVFLIISPVFTIQPHVLQSGANSVSALIAQQYGFATDFGLSALMAAGLALFVMTLLVNFAASVIINRSRSGAVSEA